MRESLFRRRWVRQEGERIDRYDERLVQEFLKAHRDLHRRGHSLEVHLDRATRDAGDIGEGAQRHLSLFAQPAKGVRVEPHVQPSGRGIEEGRDALLQEFAERPPGEDRDAEPGVDHAVLQGSGPAPFADDERRSIEDSRDLEQFVCGVLGQRIDVLEHLDDQERVVSPRPGGGLELNLLEAVYLVEGGRLDIRRRGRTVSARELFRAASASIDAFEIRYLVYRDLRSRGYVVEARGGPVDFQVYPRGGAPKKTPSKYWVRALSERAVFDLAELLGRAEEAAAVRKTLLLGLVDEESDLTYYSVREAHPRGHQPAALRKVDVVVHFLGDRAVVIDEVQAKALHEAGFFGKIVGRRLQLSLLETAYLLKAGLVEEAHPETDRPVQPARLIKKAKATQPDFELRPPGYEDLTGRGVISKTGFKYGSHFRAYEGDPETHHAKYLVHVVPKGHRGAWPEISRAVRLAHGVKKQILFGEVGDGVRYVKLERVRP